MVHLPRLHPWLAMAALLGATLMSPAAPAPPPSGGSIEKYLPDDTEAVAVVNVKQVVASPLFVKNYKKPLEALLASPAVAAWLKDSGLNPLRDVQRATVFMARSLDPGRPTYGPALGLLLQGRFDTAPLRAKMSERARALPKVVKALGTGANPLYEINISWAGRPTPLFVGLVDRGTILVTFRKDAFGVMRDKGAGKKKTAFKYPALARMLKDLKPGVSLGVVATREAAYMTSYRTTSKPAGGDRTEVKHHTLGDDGLEAFQAAATLAADFKGRITVTAVDAEKAKTMAASLSGFLKLSVASLKEGATRLPDRESILKGLEAIKVRGAGAKIIVEAEGDEAVLEGLWRTTGMGRMFQRPR